MKKITSQYWCDNYNLLDYWWDGSNCFLTNFKNNKSIKHNVPIHLIVSKL